MAAERSEADTDLLTFPKVSSILEIVRTVFAPPRRGEESPPRKIRNAAPARRSLDADGEPHRSKPQKNPEKNIGLNHILILGEENFFNH